MRRAEITPEEADEILSAFRLLPLEIHPSAALLAPAFDLAIEFGRSVYDSLYVALAVAEECVLVTADGKLHAVISASPLSAHVGWVEDEV